MVNLNEKQLLTDLQKMKNYADEALERIKEISTKLENITTDIDKLAHLQSKENSN